MTDVPVCPICHEPATRLPDGPYATNIIACQRAHTAIELVVGTEARKITLYVSDKTIHVSDDAHAGGGIFARSKIGWDYLYEALFGKEKQP